MLFYLILIIGIILSFGKNQKRNTKIFLIILVIISIFRYGIGADYFSYKYLYQLLSKSVLEELLYSNLNQEIGFRLIGSFFKSLGISYQLYLSVFSIITLIYIYKIVIKHSQNPALSLTIFYAFYYFVWVLSGIRQGLVLSVGVYYLLENLNNEKNIKCFLIFVFLSFIHASGIVLIIYLLFSKIKIKKKYLLLLILVSFIIGSFSIQPIIILLSNKITLLNRLIPYLSNTSFIIDFQTIGRLAFLFISIINYDRYIKKFPNQKKIINLYVFSFILYFIFKFSELTAARLAIYGRIIDIILLPNIIYSIKTKKDKGIFFAFILLIISLYLTKEIKTMKLQSNLQINNNIIIPYTNIFNKNKYEFDDRYYYLTIEKEKKESY